MSGCGCVGRAASAGGLILLTTAPGDSAGSTVIAGALEVLVRTVDAGEGGTGEERGVLSGLGSGMDERTVAGGSMNAVNSPSGSANGIDVEGVVFGVSVRVDGGVSGFPIHVPNGSGLGMG